MKTFLKYFAVPLLIGAIAGILYIVDAFVGKLFVEGASFMWVAFVLWTIFYGATLKDRVKGFIGVVIGFVVAVIMMLITGLSGANVLGVSVTGLLGVVLMNFAVMHLGKLGKYWLDSISGVFAGMFITFSGLGVGLNAVSSIGNTFLMLGIIAVYAIFGLVCGYFSVFGTDKINKKLAELEPVVEESKEENKPEENK